MVRSLIRFRYLRVSLALAALLPVAPSWAAVRSGHMTAALETAPAAITPGGETVLAVTLTPDKAWHTYWINPGDTGLPTDISLNDAPEVSLVRTQWPTPQKLTYDGVVTYGYDQPVTAYVHVRAAPDVKIASRLPYILHIDSLVCRDSCEPVSFNLTGRLSVSAQMAPVATPPALPVDLQAPATYSREAGTLNIRFSLPGNRTQRIRFSHPDGAYVFSEIADLIPPVAPQTLTTDPQGFTVSLPMASGTDLPALAPLVVRFADGAAVRVLAHEAAPPVAKPTAPASDGIALAVLLAFLGGLVLNLMPCVFPVLSMKLLALTRTGHDHGLARREALIYGLGAVLSFVGLSILLDVARALGGMVGWGFQLQSPYVTSALSLLMLMVGLNLSGLFEIGGSLQAAAGAQPIGRHPYLAAFMTGILAVMVAAPCSAPFMATATGVALARGGFASVAIFTALGLGFAAPFVALTFALTWMPSLARLMPRPGPWMDRLRQILAIPMYLAAAWMAWVFWQQAGPAGLGLLALGMALVAAAIIARKLPNGWRATAVIIGLALGIGSAMQTPAAPVTAATVGEVAFSQARLDALRAKGQPVLVDMTAAWCLTCKVNEHVALADTHVQSVLRAQNVAYMVGDWTHRDAEITRYLTQNGRSGVPLYVYYGPGQAQPVILPQLLTPDTVIKAVQAGR
ncbi:thioredoxin family protein [Asticcacaulis sp.]|uniref:protein-disulfide reductase DsbD family protein n=1 Tax=Asticcacaulis sp. TaxID=1872648 RepID=UPI003F7B89F2